MQRLLLILVLLLCVIALPLQAQPAATAPAAGADPALAQIAELRAGLLDAYTKKDIDKLLTYLHPDVVVTWQNSEVSTGREAVKAYYNKMMSGPDAIVDSITANPEIDGRSLNGDTSISYGHMNDSFKLKNGAAFRLDSRFSAWLVRENGAWLVRGFHLSANVFDNEIQSTIVHKSMLWTGLAAGVGGLLVGILLARIMRKPAKG